MAAINTAEPHDGSHVPTEKNETNVRDVSDFNDHDDSDISSHAQQEGVKAVEAVTQTWTKTELWMTFGL